MRRAGLAALSVVLLAALAPAAPVRAATAPLFAYEPEPPPLGPVEPPPDGYFNGPCGLAVGSGGRFYLADHYHGAVATSSCRRTDT